MNLPKGFTSQAIGFIYRIVLDRGDDFKIQRDISQQYSDPELLNLIQEMESTHKALTGNDGPQKIQVAMDEIKYIKQEMLLAAQNQRVIQEELEKSKQNPRGKFVVNGGTEWDF